MTYNFFGVHPPLPADSRCQLEAGSPLGRNAYGRAMFSLGPSLGRKFRSNRPRSNTEFFAELCAAILA